MRERKHHRPIWKRLSVLVSALAMAIAGTLTLVVPQQAAADLPGGTTFYRDPGSRVVEWVENNPGDSRQPLISDVIAERPQGIWFSTYEPSTVTSDVQAVTGPAAAAGEVPVLVAYMMPNRDCGGASAGGAPDFGAYDAWIDSFAAGLGSSPVIVIMEPDSLALISCLDDAELAQRNASLSRAGQVIHDANPAARVYLDAGHSAWNSASVQADRLRAAGVTENADGIYSNASNYRATSNEISFAQSVLSQLGDPGLGAVIDTSRNGQGPAPDSEWCDPAGRGVGLAPTSDTGHNRIDAFLWIKPPGEADGCAATAGQFVPDLAYELAQNAEDGTSSGGTTDGGQTDGGQTDGGQTDGGQTDGGQTDGGQTDGGTTAGTGDGCTAAYSVVNDWGNGFTGEIAISCDGDSLNGWTVSWEFPGDQQLSQAWNGTCSQSGSQVTCSDSGWNGTVPDGGSVSIGFNATYSGSNPVPDEVTLS